MEKELTEKVRELIGKGETEQAIKYLLSKDDSFDSSIKLQAEILSSRFSRWKKREILGINESDIELRKIEVAIIELCTDNPTDRTTEIALLEGKYQGLINWFGKKRAKVFLVTIISVAGILIMISLIYLQVNPSAYFSKDDGDLEITKVSFTYEGEFDILLRNRSDEVIVIHKIEIKKIENPVNGINPILDPTARYVIEVDKISPGESQSLNVSHFIDAKKADRILLATETTDIVKLKVTLHYNQNKKSHFIKYTW